MRRGRIRAYTLLEVIVCISIISLLLAILMPALQAIREASRRMQCASNLKQLGVAMQAYHSVSNCFPMGITKAPFENGSDYRVWNGWSAAAQMLPQLELASFYNNANFSWNPDQSGPGAPLAAAVNRTVVRARLTHFLCPSDPLAGLERLNSYHGSLGPTSLRNPRSSAGLFSVYRSHSLADCSDGASATVAFSEALVGGDRAAPRDRRNVVIQADDTSPSAQAYNVATIPDTISLGMRRCVEAFVAGRNIKDDRGSRWAAGRVGYTLFNTVATPNDPKFPLNGCRFGGTRRMGSDSQNITPSNSQHPGGVNVLMADGSLRFIRDGIASPTWWSLGTRSGAEIVAADSY